MNCYCCLSKMNEKFSLLYKKFSSFIYLLILHLLIHRDSFENRDLCLSRRFFLLIKLSSFFVVTSIWFHQNRIFIFELIDFSTISKISRSEKNHLDWMTVLKFLILLQCEYRYIHIDQQIDRWFLQSSLLFFYITSILRWFESHQVILWSHLLSSWSYNLINFAFIDRFSQLSWKSRYSRNLRISYSRIVNDSLNLIRRTRQVALWH
jgi:hypothetical protein